MPGLRHAGVAAAGLALAGGAAYLIWTYASSAEKPQPEPKKKPTPEPAESEPTDQRVKEPLLEDQEVKEPLLEDQEVKEPLLQEQGVKEPLPEEQVVAAPQAAERAEEKAPGKQVLVLGLDGSGKTSLLHCFASGSLEQDVAPTQGFNAVSINREDLQIEFLEIGGSENLRAYWRRYMSKAVVMVFVVDSSCADRFPLAKEHLHHLLSTDPLLPLVVLANKQDVPGACSITELHEALSLEEAGDQRKLFLIATYVKKGDAEVNHGVQDARDLIVQAVYDRI